MGSPLLDSGKNSPFPFIILTPKAPASAVLSINRIIFSKVSSSTNVSGFSRRTYSPWANRKAWLFALAKPRFSLLAIIVTCGKFSCSISTELSVELLSTTKISDLIFVVARTTECKHCCKKCFTL